MDDDQVIEWLLTDCDPWVEFHTRIDLLGQAKNAQAVNSARLRLIEHPQVQLLLGELKSWPGPTLTSHKTAGHLLHKLVFLSELGLKANDPGMDKIVEKVRSHLSDEGVFQIRINVPKPYGGTGEDQDTWMLCDAPLVAYALCNTGLCETDDVQSTARHLITLARSNGWPCAVSSDLGRFRGPGSKNDPCPYANLLMLKLLAQIPEWQHSPLALNGCDTALRMWGERQEQHPYLFKMGTDFCKVKAPLIWYDLLHVVDVLSQYTEIAQDPRLLEMVQILARKSDDQGRFTPESIWTSWKGWDFAQKKSPSAWLTLIVWRALRRMGIRPGLPDYP